MTPKEKCDELIDKFVDASVVEEEENYFHPRPYSLAKQCALITVNELIKELLEEINPSVHGFRHNYWKEVKQEIEKL